MNWLTSFFQDLDRSWEKASGAPVELKLIGSTALMILTGYDRGTKDADALESTDLGALTPLLLDLAGRGSELFKRHRVYLDLVAPGIPFLPRPHNFHPVAIEGLRCVSVACLDVTDVAVSKLARFIAQDVEDIREMILRGHVRHDIFVERFRSAFDMESLNGNAARLAHCAGNLNTVERDFFGVAETAIDIPESAGD